MPPIATQVRERIEHLLAVSPQSKPLVYAQLATAAELNSVNYWLELLLAAGIATFGLVLNSPAVVIGAMLVSPLMGPILAAGLALAAADLFLGIRAAINILASIAVAVPFSAALVWLLPFHSPTGEVLARTQPNLLDLGVALFSGMAGALVVCRGGSGGGVTALPGVAIAVALMPPLCTIGFGVGSGFQRDIMGGAGLLFLTNLAAIVASAFLVFYLVRMDAPAIRREIQETIRERREADPIFQLLVRTRLGPMLSDIGQLHWRVLMLLIVLGALYVPLQRSLGQLRDEVVSRAAVLEVIRGIAPREDIVSEQVEIGADLVRIRLIVAVAVPPDKVAQAQRLLLRRTGKDAVLSVRKVASEEELASLRERLSRSSAPKPSPPPEPSLEDLRARFLQKLEQRLKSVWPHQNAELTGHEIALRPEGIVARLRYRADQPLDQSVETVLGRILIEEFGTQQLRVMLDREAPPPSKVRRR